MNIKRGDIFYADISQTRGSEQGGVRPVMIVQNDVGNLYSPTTIIACITSSENKANIPTHIELKQYDGRSRDSVLMFEQIRTIDKSRLMDKIDSLNKQDLARANTALKISFGLN